MTEKMIVSEINYYPIKSCAGISTQSAVLDSRGIKHDRELMVVGKNKDGRYELVRQSRHPGMARILPNIGEASFSVALPYVPSHAFPVVKQGTPLDVIVHNSTCAAIDQGNEAARWFNEALGGDYRVVRMAEDFVRKLNPKYAVRESDQTGFQDGYPLLMISQESLDDLNSRMVYSVRMNRFRPNLVIAGSEVPYIEDKMRKIKVGDVVFDVVKPCDRCPIPGIEQETGNVTKEPLATLAKYRRCEYNGKTAVWFGQNIVHETPGIIKVGDPVQIIEYNREKIKFPERSTI